MIETKPSLEGIKGKEKFDSLYFGVGLCNKSKLSEGLPFDVLSMILCGEKLKRFLGLNKNYILIADTHAKINGFDGSEINELTRKEFEIFEKILDSFGLENWDILTASSFDSGNVYQDILKQIPETDKYVRREMADIEWFVEEKSVDLKLGWCLNGLGYMDERFFDKVFSESIGEDIGFVYTRAGKRFDKRKPNVPPYLCVEKDKRLLLEKEEDIDTKLEKARISFRDKNLGGSKKYFNRILRLYKELIKPVEGETLSERISSVIEVVYG